MIGKELATKLVERGEKIFLNPTVTYPWEDIINGVKIVGKSKLQSAVSGNTWRSFKKKKRTLVLRTFFLIISNQTKINY